MMHIEHGRQGPSQYWGILCKSPEGGGALAIVNVFPHAGAIHYGEVYRFVPPGTEAAVGPVVDYEWLQQHIGKRVEMTATFCEGRELRRSYAFKIQQPDGSTEVAVFE